MSKILDWKDRTNGAVFLGLNGIVVKSHGGMNSYGFANAICVAHDMVKYNFYLSNELKPKLLISANI